MKTGKIRRWAAALLAVAVLLSAGVALRWAFRFRQGVQGNQLERTDLPGFAPTDSESLLGLMPTENHCTRDGSVTLTDDAGRGWRVQVPGWSLQWAETNGVGARVVARNLDTGAIRDFYLGKEADTFEFYPQTMGEELYADALGQMNRFLFWRWRVSPWTESGFRDFTRQMTVEAVPAGDVGQRVAFGDRLDLQQTGDFNGSLLITGDRVAAPQLTLCARAPTAYDGATGTQAYTSAGGLTWTLYWWETDPAVLADKGMQLAACCEDTGDWVQIRLDGQYLEPRDLDDPDGALEAARQALDHILPRT